MGILNKLNGWLRAALLFTIIWCGCVIGLALYERLVTIGDTSGPWALYGHYSSLVFHHVEISGEDFSFWLQKKKFYTSLVLPPFLAWLFAGGLVPAFRWVRHGFGT